MPNRKIDLPQMRRAAEVLPASFDEAARTIEAVWSTGAVVRRVPWFDEPYDEEISLDPAHVRLDQLNAGAPVLKVHEMTSLESVIGSVVPGSARVSGGVGTATLRFSDDAEAAPIVEKIKAGHIRAVSVGYRVHRYEITKRDGAPDLWRAVDWTPLEISAVPIGADPGAGFRAAQTVAPCVVGEVLETRMDENAAPAPRPDETAAPALAEVRNDAAVAPRESRDGDVRAAIEGERQRIAGIYAVVSKLKLDRALGDDLVRDGVSLDKAREIAIDKAADQADQVRTFPEVAVPLGGRDEKVTRREAAITALLNRYSPAAFPLTDAAREYRGMSLLEMGRTFLAESGERVRGLDRSDIAQRSLMTTSDFPAVLSAVSNKTLRQAYEAAPRTFLPFCRRVTAVDFKPMNRVQLGGAPKLEKVNEAGEYKRGTLAESKESYAIATYGKVVAITRQVIINDDLDAFTRIPALFGVSIANLESDTVWGIITANAALADGTALFHANHANLAGTASVIDAANVALGVAAMAKQKDLDNATVLNVRPQYLLAPVGKILVVQQLLGTIVPNQVSSVVPSFIAGLTPIVEPRLDAAAANTWYLAADPSQIDTVEYAYLEGQEGAYMEARMGFDVDGVEVKCRLDFGAKAIDFRGLYKNAGA